MPGGIHPPPQVIASWPTPNYENPQTQGPALMAVTILLSAVGVFTVGARLYSRIAITKVPGLDDALAVISLLFGLGLSILVIYGNQKVGTGRHIWDVPLPWGPKNRLITWCCEWCFVLSTGLIKVSILLFYKRLSAPFTKAFLWATWAGIIYNILYMVGFLLPLLLQCHPLEAYWMQVSVAWLLEGRKYHCTNEGISLPLSAAFSVIGDFYTTLLPLILVHGLNMPNRQKVALYGLFSMGFIVVIAGIVRTYYLNYVINNTYDVLWYIYVMWVWTILELYLAMIAASAPALKPFFQRFLMDPIRTATVLYGTNSSSSVPGGSRSRSRSRNKHRRLSSPFPFHKHSQTSQNRNSNTNDAWLDLEADSKSKYEMTSTTTTINPTAPLPKNGAIARERTYEVSRSDSPDPPTTNPNLAPPLASSGAGGGGSLAFARHPALTSGKGLRPRGAEEREANPFAEASFAASRVGGPLMRPRLLTQEEDEYHDDDDKESARDKVIDNVDLSSSVSSSGTSGGIGGGGGSVSRSSSTVTAPQHGPPRPRDFVYDGGVGVQSRRRGLS